MVGTGEQARLDELRASGILDTPPEAAFDALVELASRLFDVPIAMVSLVDEHRQWFKARVGIGATEMPRAQAFCAHAIEGDGVMVVEDAAADARFAQNPLVTDFPDIRFYAGHPLRTRRGNALGTFCVLDRRPRTLSTEELRLLAILADQAVMEIELRRAGLAERDARLELRAAEARYRALAESMTGGLVIHQEGTIRFANQAAAALFGVGVEQLIGTSVFDTAPDWWRAEFERLVADVYAGRAVSPFTRPLLGPPGVPKVVEAHLRVVEWDGSPAVQAELRDVTVRAVAEVELRRSEERFRLVLDAAPIGLAVVESDGRFSRVNPALCRMVGRTESEILSHEVGDLIYPDDREVSSRWSERLHCGEIDSYELEKRYVHADGHPVPVLVHAAAVRDRAGDHVCYVAQIVDLTERRRVEAARELQALELDALNRELQRTVAIKDHVLAVASHEMRSPITTILGFTEVLARLGAQLPDDQRAAALESIERQGRRLELLVNDLLSVTVIESGAAQIAPEDVDLHPFVEVLVGDLQLDLEVRNRVTPGTVVRADPQRLAQIVANLLTNAKKYGAAPITVEGASGSHAEIRVSDAGPGVPEAFVPFLFDKFSTASRVSPRGVRGTGLGLAIVRALTEAHGGHITYEGGPTGACFVVRLPVAGP